MKHAAKFLSVLTLMAAGAALAADHNDPNQINSIYSDVPPRNNPNIMAADIYDLFGWPSDDTKDGEKIIIALTFGAEPRAGTLNPELMYRVLMYPGQRAGLPDSFFEGITKTRLSSYIATAIAKALPSKYSEVRVNVEGDGVSQKQEAVVSFVDFDGGNFTRRLSTNQVSEITTPTGHKIKAYVGGRDDAFFNDLPGFFRSINYAPQFYKVPVSDPLAYRELAIPKTLIELEGNTLFNFDPRRPLLGLNGAPETRYEGFSKPPLPEFAKSIDPNKQWRFAKYPAPDGTQKYRLVYTGHDAQHKRDINAVILEVPLAYITKDPKANRIVNMWSESLEITADAKVSGVKTQPGSKEELAKYRLIDTDGQAFADAALCERYDDRQRGYNNIALGLHFALRLAHLGWGFAPSITALGLPTSFNFPISAAEYADCTKRGLSRTQCQSEKFPASRHVVYNDPTETDGVTNIFEAGARITKIRAEVLARRAKARLSRAQPDPQEEHVADLTDALLRVTGTLFQKLEMPDDSWRKNKAADIKLRRSFEIFVPNVNSVDMDTNGTWPFGRRPEDQVATRFLSLFLDMKGKIGGKPVTVESLNDPNLYYSAPIMPNPDGKPVQGPNPARNMPDDATAADREHDFTKEFPYLGKQWDSSDSYQ